MAEVHEARGRIGDARIEKYQAFPQEHHRPPSRGGNTSALHVHVLTVSGERYSFFALGTKQWVYKGDTVSFDYVVVKDGKYRNIDRSTLETKDKDGNTVIRGDRRWKPTLRSAPTRMPASRREQQD